MSKTVKILMLLTFIALLLVVYLIMSSKIITLKPAGQNTALLSDANTSPKVEKVDLVKLEMDYKEKVKPIFIEFEQMMNNYLAVPDAASVDGPNVGSDSVVATTSPETGEGEVLDRISELKIGLMDITVPEQYRDLHLDLVLSFSKIKSSIESKSETEKTDGLALLRQAKNEYGWLAQ